MRILHEVSLLDKEFLLEVASYYNFLRYERSILSYTMRPCMRRLPTDNVPRKP